MESTKVFIWGTNYSDWHEGNQKNWKILIVLEETIYKNCILVLTEKKVIFRGLQRH